MELNLPDEILAKLLNLFYSMLFDETFIFTFNVKILIVQVLTKFLKYSITNYVFIIKTILCINLYLSRLSKEIDSKLFKADWHKFYLLIDGFTYPKNENCPGFHKFQTVSFDNFIELAKRIKK